MFTTRYEFQLGEVILTLTLVSATTNTRPVGVVSR